MKLRDVPSAIGSPAYVYDLGEIRAAVKALMSALPMPSKLYYSLKANPHPAVVGAAHAAGAAAEISSEGELSAALKAGVPAGDLLYSGPGKTRGELETALKAGVGLFSVESTGDLARLSEAAMAVGRKVEALLRFNPDRFSSVSGLAMTGKPSQFGVDEAVILADPIAYRGDDWARVVGFHCYLGSNIERIEDLAETFISIAEIAVQLSAATGIPVERLDFGGGFPAPYGVAGERPPLAGLAALVEPVFDRLLPGWRTGSPQIIFESGRHLVGTSGSLFGTVVDIKASKGHDYAVLDFGINHFGGMAGLRRIPRVTVTVESDADDRGPRRPVTLVGPLCTPLDVVAGEIDLPPLVVGDVLRLPNVGAYGLSASLLAFLSHTTPWEVALDEGQLVHVSRIKFLRQEIKES